MYSFYRVSRVYNTLYYCKYGKQTQRKNLKTKMFLFCFVLFCLFFFKCKIDGHSIWVTTIYILSLSHLFLYSCICIKKKTLRPMTHRAVCDAKRHHRLYIFIQKDNRYKIESKYLPYPPLCIFVAGFARVCEQQGKDKTQMQDGEEQRLFHGGGGWRRIKEQQQDQPRNHFNKMDDEYFYYYYYFFFRWWWLQQTHVIAICLCLPSSLSLLYISQLVCDVVVVV